MQHVFSHPVSYSLWPLLRGLIAGAHASMFALAAVVVVFSMAAYATGQEATRGGTLSRQAQLVIEATRELNPQTPAEVVGAIINLLNVGAEAEAKTYFDRLTEGEPTDAQLAAVYDQLGAAAVFRIGRETKLGPKAAELSRRVIRAANAAASSPKRLRELTEQLIVASPDKQLSIAENLSRGRAVAAARLLSAMVSCENDKQYDILRRAWRKFDQDSLPPVLAALRCDDPKLQRAALTALAELRRHEALPFLVGYAETEENPQRSRWARRALERTRGVLGAPTDAAAFLEEEVMRRLHSTRATTLDTEPLVDTRKVVWRWNPNDRRPTISKYPPRVVELMEANQLAYDLAKYRPGQSTLYQLTEFALVEAIFDREPEKVVAEVMDRMRARDEQPRPLAISDVLAWALQREVPEAAEACCRTLGSLKDESVLHSRLGVSPLAKALRSPHPNVQREAALAIMRLQPTRAFAGVAEFVPRAVAMATTTGKRTALVVHPVAVESSNLAGLLMQAEWAAVTASTGREAYRHLVDSRDIDLILLSDALRKPLFTELLQQLRFDPTTAQVPLVIISRRGELAPVRARVDRFATRSEPIRVFPFPVNGESLARLLRRSIRPEDLVSPERRKEEANVALQWMQQVTSDLAGYSFFELPQYDGRIVRALANPNTAEAAAIALGQLGTPVARTALAQAVENYPANTPLGQVVRRALHQATGLNRTTGSTTTGSTTTGLPAGD